MKKIALLGGTFDPIHKAHIEIAKKAVSALGLDKVIFVVAGQPPHKTGDYRIDAFHRYNMVKIAIVEEKCFEVSDYEIKKRGKSYSYLTAAHFKNKYPDSKIYFIIGDEAFREMSSWRHPEKLSELVKFAVFTRDGGTVSGKCEKIEIEPINISSTQIREMLAEGKDAGELLPDGVMEYIRKNNLYGVKGDNF